MLVFSIAYFAANDSLFLVWDWISALVPLRICVCCIACVSRCHSIIGCLIFPCHSNCFCMCACSLLTGLIWLQNACAWPVYAFLCLPWIPPLLQEHGLPSRCMDGAAARVANLVCILLDIAFWSEVFLLSFFAALRHSLGPM